MEDYYQNKKLKRNDFLKGVLINLIVSVIVASLYFIVMALLSSIDGDLGNKIIAGMVMAVLILAVLIYEIISISKHLKGRRYIAIGMIVAIVLPLLAFGACSPFLIDMTWG